MNGRIGSDFPEMAKNPLNTTVFFASLDRFSGVFLDSIWQILVYIYPTPH